MKNNIIHNIGTISLLSWLILLIKVPEIWTLIYPASSLLQLTASIGTPIIDLPPPRRVFFDWGLQMNYDMPFNVTSFFNIPIWPTKRNITKRMIDIDVSDDYDADNNGHCHYYDLGLLDFYEQLERSLKSYGYHKTCLLRSICELAQFSFEEDYMKLIGDILNFFGRPSIFNHHQSLKIYTTAELKGYLDYNCAKIYRNCEKSPLDVFSKVVVK